MTLSKSNYIDYLKHPALLWLSKYDKSKLPPTDENTQEAFDAGHEFEFYVEKLYPKAIRLGFDPQSNDYQELPARTLTAMEEADTILQGRFEADGLTCIVDILEKAEDNTYALTEIKSGTKVKDEYLYDLAFQTIVLEKCGDLVGINTMGVSGMSFFISAQYASSVMPYLTDQDIKKIDVDPTKSPEEAARAFYTYLKARRMQDELTLRRRIRMP